MKTWESILIPPDLSLRDAMARIDRGATQLALVVGPDRRLLGTLSDGDIRRGLLAGVQLTDPVERCMCRTPTTASVADSRDTILAAMRRELLHHIPVLDGDGRVVDLLTIDNYLAAPDIDNPVVIMAGGLGRRLKELTRDTPKPLLPVGDRPLLDTVITRFVAQGFRNIWLAVNYHAAQIEQHVGDGARLGARVQYLREASPLGTAGALSLLPPPKIPVLVTNADVLTTVDYAEMLTGHLAIHAAATMGVREYEYQIPFGVIRVTEDFVVAFDEKPIHQTLVNAGIYVLAPDAVAGVPAGVRTDMSEVFLGLIAAHRPVRCHRVRGYWLDIGRHEDFQQANVDFPEVFL